MSIACQLGCAIIACLVIPLTACGPAGIAGSANDRLVVTGGISVTFVNPSSGCGSVSSGDQGASWDAGISKASIGGKLNEFGATIKPYHGAGPYSGRPVTGTLISADATSIQIYRTRIGVDEGSVTVNTGERTGTVSMTLSSVSTDPKTGAEIWGSGHVQVRGTFHCAPFPSPSSTDNRPVLLDVSGGAGTTQTRPFRTPPPETPWTIQYSFDCSAIPVDGSFFIVARGSGPTTDFVVSLAREPQVRYGPPQSGSRSLGEEGTVTLTVSSVCPWHLTVRT